MGDQKTKTVRSPINFKLIGVAFVAMAVTITLFIRCPAKAQLLSVYALLGIGISLIFVRSIEKATFTYKVGALSMTLAGGAAFVVIFIYIDPVDKFKPDSCPLSEVSLTVFVHGPKGKQDMILQGKGFVVLDIRSERKTSSINEKGEAFFQNLHAGDNIRLNIDFSEPYKAINPDSVYTIDPGQDIYLAINLQGTDKIAGMVLFDESPLSGVQVKVDAFSTTTDSTGGFFLKIPEAARRDSYEVQFIKSGFLMKSVPAFPQTNQPLEITMEKLGQKE